MPLNEDRYNGNYKLFYNKQSFKTLSCVLQVLNSLFMYTAIQKIQLQSSFKV